MPKALSPGQAYAGRRADAVVINTTLDAAAADILRHYAPAGRKGLGHFLSRLLYEYDARVLEREQWRRKLALVLNADEE